MGRPIAASLLWTVLSTWTSLSAAADIPSCSSGIAGSYLPLANYPPAQTYCSNNYSNSTVTYCDPTSSSSAKVTKRDGIQHLSTTTTLTSLFHSFLDLSPSTASSICACLQPASTCPAGSTCSASTSTCLPQHNCNRPSRCSGESFCGTAASNGAYMFCHADTDTPDMGYCMSGGSGCPKDGEYEDCARNEDCGGGWRVCISACCREQPFCVDIRAYVESVGMGVIGTVGFG